MSLFPPINITKVLLLETPCTWIYVQLHDVPATCSANAGIQDTLKPWFFGDAHFLQSLSMWTVARGIPQRTLVKNVLPLMTTYNCFYGQEVGLSQFDHRHHCWRGQADDPDRAQVLLVSFDDDTWEKTLSVTVAAVTTFLHQEAADSMIMQSTSSTSSIS